MPVMELSMNYQFLTLEAENRTAVVRIDRPDKKNALSIGLIEELVLMAEDLKKRSDLITVILAGGDSYFSPGVDLSDPRLFELFGAGLVEKRKAMEYGPRMCRAWEELDQFTIAAIEGFCVGGGVALAASLDFRVMAESSFIRVPEIGLGMNMAWTTLPRLVHLVGPARAKEIVIFADRVPSKDAFEWGFAQRISPDGQALLSGKEDRRDRLGQAPGTGDDDQADGQRDLDGPGSGCLAHGYRPVHPLDHVGGFQRGRRGVPGET